MARQRVDDLAARRSTDAEDKSPHYVYRLYDRNGGLLYIGCTFDPQGRIETFHKGEFLKPPHLMLMKQFISHWTCWRYPNKAAARAAERSAIATEQPPFNKQHRGPGVDFAAGIRPYAATFDRWLSREAAR